MTGQYKLIFDMDGTLYRFDKGRKSDFASSYFYSDLRQNAYRFFMDRFGFSQIEAELEYERINKIYSGELSIGIEREFGIDRYEYFEKVWNLDPEMYIERNEDFPVLMGLLSDSCVLLTAAPRIWTTRVLAFLELTNVFGEMVYTGEPDIRKPNPNIFKNIAQDLQTSPNNIFSIGDQEYTDIIPAKSLGMRTVLVGKGSTQADYQVENVEAALILLGKEGFI